MKTVLIALMSWLLAACASAPPMPPATDLFHDSAFAPPAEPIDPGAALAVSPAMRTYLAANFAQRSRNVDRRRQLINALYRGDLKLEYDAESTRTAAEAFDARSGNCLALVLMTAAFAKDLVVGVSWSNF